MYMHAHASLELRIGDYTREAMDSATHAPLLPETNLESRRRQPAWALLLSAVLLLGIAGLLVVVYGSRHGGVVPASLGDGNISPEYDWTNTMLSWQRTAFHFQPPKSWMNDPNGPLYYKGWYHLFYQANPASAVWGNISWGHAVSRDLLHWRHLPLAMAPDHWYDINGVWSGSATLLPDGRVVMLYTGGTDESVQVQLLAEPADLSDPLLRSWVKSEANPVLLPPPGVGTEDFRDPTTAWRNPTDSAWRVAVGSKTRDRTGQALLFRTEDFLSYDLAPAPLHATPGSGMWECVDFYPVHVDVGGVGLETSAAPGPGVKHVLKASIVDDNSDYYAIGTYHAANDTWTPETAELHAGVGLRYDYGKFYASKTFYDPVRQRRVLWGWVSETDTERADILKGWASLQSIPRTVVMDTKTGSNLLQWPVVEVENLRTRGISFDDLAVQPGSLVPLDVGKATQLDIEAVFHVDASAAGSATATDAAYDLTTSTGAAERGLLGPFGLLVLADEGLSEQTAVYFYLLKAEDGSLTTFFGQDELRSSKANDLIKTVYGSLVPVLHGEDLSVRILVDHSIVESFAQGGRVCVTSRVYPTKAIYDDARVFLFNNATDIHVTVKSLKIWELNSA